MKKVAVVTVNYDTEEETKTLLKSLEKIKLPDISLDVIVVDNGSEHVLELADKKDINLIRLSENTGFSGGFNVGIKKALALGNDFVLIVNSDTIVDPGLVVELKKYLENNEHVGVVVPKIYFAAGHEFHKDRYKKEDLGKVFWYSGGYIDWDNVQSVHKGVDEVDKGQYEKVEKIDFATGCCMMFKKEVFEKVGFFDEKYFLYYEDADMSVRVQKKGYNIYYVPSAVLYHMNASSSGGAGKGNTLQDYFITRNQMLFGMSYAPFRAKLALLRQGIRLLVNGRPEQKRAIKDFYLGRFGKGTFFDN